MIQRTTQIGIDGMTWGDLRRFVALSPHLDNSPVSVVYDEGEALSLAFYEDVGSEGDD